MQVLQALAKSARMIVTPQSTVSPGNGRLEALDTLRFLAALAVLLSHARSMFPWEPISGIVSADLFNPKSAVAFFFVLSGFVLHLSWKGAWPVWGNWSRFTIRRFFRIYPLYYVSLLIAWVVVSTLPLAECPYFSTDAAGSEVLKADRSSVLQWLHHVLLITPGIDMQFLNPPIWTLTAEMRMALIFPWLSWLTTRSGKWAWVLLPLFFAAGPWLGARTLPTVALIPLFFLGAVAAEQREKLRLSKPLALIVLLAGLAAYSAAPMLRSGGSGSLTWQMYAAGGGSVLAMLAVLSSPWLIRLLEQRGMVMGGQASYGVYVLHFPLLMALACLSWMWALPAWLFQVMAVVSTLLLALPLYRWFELPMMRLGRQWTSPPRQG